MAPDLRNKTVVETSRLFAETGSVVGGDQGMGAEQFHRWLLTARRPLRYVVVPEGTTGKAARGTRDLGALRRRGPRRAGVERRCWGDRRRVAKAARTVAALRRGRPLADRVAWQLRRGSKDGGGGGLVLQPPCRRRRGEVALASAACAPVCVSDGVADRRDLRARKWRGASMARRMTSRFPRAPPTARRPGATRG